MKLERTAHGWTVLRRGEPLGRVRLTENPYHRTNAYLRFFLSEYDHALAPALFAEIRQAAGKPLQVMTESADRALTEFLVAGGFSLARRCFEVTASPADCGVLPDWEELLTCTPEDGEYDDCCRILYDHYQATHAAINPFTGEESTFRSALPTEVFFDRRGGEITALAFVEGQEIAYVWGRTEEEFLPFASALLRTLFARGGAVSFECDDCDGPALWLRALAGAPEDGESFNTYLYK